MYEFYRANIHERRLAAYVVRAVPVGSMAMCAMLIAVGILWRIELLLFLCAVLNISVWLFIVSMALFGILGAWRIRETCRCAEMLSKQLGLNQDPCARVTNVVVYPNYQEDEGMLAETLQSLQEAAGSAHFVVVLGMEEREGAGVRKKAQRLQDRFGGSFAKVLATFHPPGLLEEHLDGTSNEEVPGKASNLKWAVAKAHEFLSQDPAFDVEQAVMTVSDADVLFHPSYFQWISSEFVAMQEAADGQHHWTMWQSPQLPYRNYSDSPAPSRIWGYISSVYEFGGVSSLYFMGHHMVFSAYSVSMHLAVKADLWDGDVIAEDHHAYLKAFFYSAFHSANVLADQHGRDEMSCLSLGGCEPKLRVRPVMLPAKSTSVVSARGYWATCVERWHQATRHCQGVSELSYGLLATWDMLRTLPLNMYSLRFAQTAFKVMFRPFMMHIIPNCQGMALGALTVYWVAHHRSVPRCPDRIWMASSDGETLLCGLAGAWALTWPVVIPLFLVGVANFCFLWCSFLSSPPETAKDNGEAPRQSLWHASDGGVEPTLGSKALSLAGKIFIDNAVFMAPVMVPYGLGAECVGCWNVLVRGNHFKYISAAKALKSTGGADYGTMSDPA